MVDQPLLNAAALTGFPGAPFTAAVVDPAAGHVRALCGWHVAPVVTETVTVETGASSVVLLPSLRVVSVAEVRDEDGNVLTGWKVRPNGVLRIPGGWPDVIEVDLKHGHESCPSELAAVVAEHARRVSAGGVKAESLSGRSVQLDTLPSSSAAAALDRHTLPGRP